jgi:NADP-dependent 3-hydroxy acid dehydrogenase YdfG
MMTSKTAIITGASRGIGFAIMEKLAENGFNIAFCSKNSDNVAKAEELIKKNYPNINILALTCDMSVKADVISFAKKCLETYSSIDILVNNAGVYTPGVVSNDDYQDNLEELMKTNVYSAYWIGKVIIPQMRKQMMGHIFTISSIAGIQAYENGGSYAISKFALTGYIKTIRAELRTQNIRVTGIFPGATLTDSWSASDLPNERFIQPKDIAEILYTTYHLSPSTCVEDIIIRPQLGDI